MLGLPRTLHRNGWIAIALLALTCGMSSFVMYSLWRCRRRVPLGCRQHTHSESNRKIVGKLSESYQKVIGKLSKSYRKVISKFSLFFSTPAGWLVTLPVTLVGNWTVCYWTRGIAGVSDWGLPNPIAMARRLVVLNASAVPATARMRSVHGRRL